MDKHIHTKDCVSRDARGYAHYTPCRVDGLDRNLRLMNPADFECAVRIQDFRGLTLICGK